MSETQNTPGYEESVAELEKILREIQSDSCSIDKLTALTARASELLAICRRKLTATETELTEILKSLEN